MEPAHNMQTHKPLVQQLLSTGVIAANARCWQTFNGTNVQNSRTHPPTQLLQPLQQQPLACFLAPTTAFLTLCCKISWGHCPLGLAQQSAVPFTGLHPPACTMKLSKTCCPIMQEPDAGVHTLRPRPHHAVKGPQPQIQKPCRGVVSSPWGVRRSGPRSVS